MIFSPEFDSILPEIERIDRKKVKDPTISTGILVQEAFNLYVWAQYDLKELKQYGMPHDLPDTLLVTAKACAEIQARWFCTNYGKQKVQQTWKEMYKKGLEIRKQLFHYFTFAFRDDKQLLDILNQIKKGEGAPDLIQDLATLSTLGTHHLDRLIALGFDANLLSEASEMVNPMAGTLAEKKMEEQEREDVLHLRNRAMVRLQQLLSELREIGKFVFKDNPIRIEGYKQQYKRRKSKKV